VKRCRRCGEDKPLDEFYAEKSGRDGRRPECKACTAAQRKQWYAANKEREIARVRAWQQANPDRVKASQHKNREQRNRKMRELHLRNKFDLTPAQYDQMLDRQGGGCAICGDPARADSSLHVDHDHGSGEIRGLLCMRCNNAIGLLKEDPCLLRRAANYVVLEPRARSARDELTALAQERARALVKAGI
jgi:hypothetical protein